ncbi:MAG: DUF4293 domain-containing protein [Reichenbachiella sp.]
MIQRIQTVFLTVTAGCMVALLFFPIWNKIDVEKSEMVELTALTLVHQKTDVDTGEVFVLMEKDTFYIAILSLIAAVVAGLSIFQFNNRLLQIKLGALNSLLMAGSLGLSVYFLWNAQTILLPGEQGNYIVGFYLYVAAMISNSLANRFIKRDEQLVRSADRIR